MNFSKDCNYHIYDANPQRYGDIYEMLKPVQEWIRIQYPNDTYLVVKSFYADLVMNKQIFIEET